MKETYSLIEGCDVNTLLEIAERRFPEYKSYIQSFIPDAGVCINRNPLFRAAIFVKHNAKKGTTKLIVNDNVTVLGSLLVGPLWGSLIFKGFFDEVKSVYREELARLAEA